MGWKKNCSQIRSRKIWIWAKRSWACQCQDLIKTEFARRRSEAWKALFISVRPPKSPYPRTDSPANALWCHPPGVQWLMHPGCQLLHSCEVGELREEVNGLNFPQIETSKCEQSLAWGLCQSPAEWAAYLQHCECAVSDVLPPSLSLIFRKCSPREH